jgi:cysteine desulfurase family protein
MSGRTKASAIDDTSVDGIIYLDNAATTFPKPDCVYEAADSFYRQYGGNAGRGNNPLARACAKLLDETRQQLAAWLDAPTPSQVIFTASATHALNLAIFGRAFQANDTVYVTPFEHNSVLRPIEHLHQAKGIQVRQIPFNRRTYECQFDKLQVAFQVEVPAMVCVTHASNVCGVMPPVAEIAKLAKAANPDAVVIVDGAQTAGLYPLPLQDGLIDALIFSGHKALYGPYGIAGLVLGTDWRPTPLFYGGTGTISESVQMPVELPSAYEAGSHNMLAIAGLHAALGWLSKTGRESIVQNTLTLASKLRDDLSEIEGIELFVPAKNIDWCGIISLAVEDTLPQTIENALGAQNIAVRAGLHCAPWAHKWLKTISIGGTARISPSCFNKVLEIQELSSTIQLLINERH